MEPSTKLRLPESAHKWDEVAYRLLEIDEFKIPLIRFYKKKGGGALE